MKSLVSRLMLACLLIPLAWPAWGAALEVRAPGQQVIPLALTRLLPLTGTAHPEAEQEFHQVVGDDLEFSGLFRFIDSEAFLDDAGRLGLDSGQVDFQQWRLLGTSALIKGGYSLDGDNLVVEARLFDALRGRLLTGQRYSGRRQDVRAMAHAFADQVLKALTGDMGSFRAKIAYINDQTGYKELYMMDVDGSSPTRLTNHRTLVLNPDFAPQGKEIAFTSYRSGNPDLYRMEVYTQREARISSHQGLNVAGRYRPPDGREVALTITKDGNADIYIVGVDGRNLRRVTTSWGIDVDPSWSPDGQRIAFVSDRLGSPQIFVIDAGGGKERRITQTGSYNVTPAWSPDGQRIAFSRLEGGRFDIYSVRADGGDERRLTFGSGNKEHPRWSPDGRFLVYSSSQGGKREIYVMRADGSGSRRVSSGAGNSFHPAWSPRW
jgi:TolB protein